MKPLGRLLALLIGITAGLHGERPPPPGAMIDIGGGQRMHLHCAGTGSPTVILEAGAGGFSVAWALVQPAADPRRR